MIKGSDAEVGTKRQKKASQRDGDVRMEAAREPGRQTRRGREQARALLVAGKTTEQTQRHLLPRFQDCLGCPQA